MQSISAWLESLGLEQYAQAFADNDIDFELISDLSDLDLEKIGVSSLGHRKKLLKAIAQLGETSAAPPAGAAQPLATDNAERRQLTVMFCDLVGSTLLSQKLDPETLRELMQVYQKNCSQVIEKYDGHVAQYLGDGLMVYFGWPRAHEDDAERAIRAALEIVELVKNVPAPEPLQVRIGITTGPVVVGETGDGDASQPKIAVGETPNLAARFQGLANADEIVIGPATRRLVRDAFDYVDLGSHNLKGIVEPMQAWRVSGLTRRHGRFDAAHGEAELTPMVGRNQEIGLLIDRWQQSQDGEGQVVLLSGEPGIGKSRILNALRERLQDEGATPMRFQCSPYHANSAFWPCIDNFERTLEFTRDESVESKLDKLEALIVEQYGRPRSDVRFVAAMLSIPSDARYGALAMPPQKFKDETLRALVDLTEAAAKKQPSVMLFEDAHWADPTTLEVLDLMLDRVSTIPLLVVLTHRPEFENRWADHGHVTGLNLSKLTRAQSSALVSRVAGGKALPAELLEQILAKTDGVPLFVEELTKSILESGELADKGDRYEYAGGNRTVTVPATLRDSLMARLDRDASVKEIAQIGATIGREFSYELISVVAPLSTSQLDEALGQLTESGLAFKRGTPPDATYTFKHALVQDAAYDSLLKKRRQELHGMIAKAIEEHLPQSKDTEPEVLAQHLTEAGEFEAAIPLWKKAGAFALDRSLPREGLAHLDKARQALNELPKTRERTEQHIDLCLEQRGVLYYFEKHARLAELLDEAEALAEELDDQERLGWVLAYRTNFQIAIQGNGAKAIESGRKACAIAEKTGVLGLKVVANSYLGQTLWYLGEYRQAADTMRRATTLVKDAKPGERFGLAVLATAFTRFILPPVLSHLGEFPEAISVGEEALSIANQANHIVSEFWTRWGLGYAYLQRGEHTRAIEVLERAVVQCREMGIRIGLPLGTILLASAYGRSGRESDAMPLIEEAERAGRTLLGLQAYVALYRADVYLSGGNFAEAREQAEQAIALAHELHQRGWEAESLKTLGDSRAQAGVELGQASEDYRRALGLATELGMRPLEAHCHLGLGKLHADASKLTEAKEHLSAAIALYQEMGMQFWLDKADAAVKELG
ncbi:MAG: AAA family ATPase [Betaproteobacteria bacterium]|nr:MAG: AAA family ATPase [Betaproteobacteria bacterium]